MRRIVRFALAVALLGAVALPATAQDPHVVGNPEAPAGGVFRDRIGVPPSMLHPLNATDAYANQVLNRIYESLVDVDVDSMDFLPALAERWAVSEDKLRYTFHLNPRARWQDGEPVTAADVAFSFNVMFAEGLKTRAKWASYYGNFTGVEVLDEHTVRFTAKQDNFRNMVNIGGLRVLPKHGFPGDDPNETPLSKEPMGSGPYQFERWDRGSFVRLVRDPDYWGWHLPQNQGRHNYKRWLTKVIATDKVALESLKKGELDLMTLTPDQWVKETSGPEFGLGPDSDTPIVKLDVQNQAPRSYGYVGWNLESPLFRDPRVRRAMSHLFDRDTFIEKFYHGLQGKAVGPFAANSPYSSPNVEPIEFSVTMAIELLREAGWSDSDGDRVFDKDGRALRFTIMTADPETSVKILTLTKETMRKAGVAMEIKVVDWSTLLQLLDEYRFDAVKLGWSRTRWPDPTALWHSDGAKPGGLNFVRYRNEEVDALIERGVRSIPQEERIDIYRRIHEIIYADQPYTFLTEQTRSLVARGGSLSQAEAWYAYSVGQDYWWFPQATP